MIAVELWLARLLALVDPDELQLAMRGNSVFAGIWAGCAMYKNQIFWLLLTSALSAEW